MAVGTYLATFDSIVYRVRMEIVWLTLRWLFTEVHSAEIFRRVVNSTA